MSLGRLSLGALGFVVALHCALGCDLAEREPLPVLASVPEFRFIDQRGEAIEASALEGTPWVVDFIFTRCTSACPMLTSQMANLRRRLGDDAEDVAFVSISVDPDHDTPEALSRFAEAHGADLPGWYFLTGESEAVRSAVVEGFRVRMGTPEESPSGAVDVMHAQHFLLVDPRRRIRGYYRSDGDGLDDLERDLKRLLEGEG